MKVLIKLSNDWPEHVSGNPVLMIIGFTKDSLVRHRMLLLCEDGNVYQSYIKMPFSVEKKEFQLFRHTHR